MMLKPVSKRVRVGLLVAFAVLLSLSGLVAGANTWRRSAPSTTTLPEIVKPAPVPVSAQGKGADIKAELITIVPHGFEPQELTLPQGRFLLMIENRSGLEAVTLTLTLEGGARVLEMQVPREEPDWSEAVNLEPGSYLLTEADHSDWICVITITP